MVRKLECISIAILNATIVSGCGGGTAESLVPTETPAVFNPPVVKSDQPTSTPRPTPTEAVEATAEPTEPEVNETFAVNGVTMPFGRSEVIINDQDDFTIFDSFNGMIPNGWNYHSGIVQIASEYLWYVNYATG